MDQISDKNGLRPSASVSATDTQDGIVLFDFEEGMTFPLDTVGTIIWKSIEQGSDLSEIAAQIARTFNVPLEKASTDVNEFVQQLRKNKLLLEDQDIEAISNRVSWQSLAFWKWFAGKNNLRGRK
jgi:hypothetical protein